MGKEELRKHFVTIKKQNSVHDASKDHTASIESSKNAKDTSRKGVNKEIDKQKDKSSKIKPLKNELFILLSYLIAIGSIELIITYYSTQLGILLDIILLFVLLINSSVTESHSLSYLLRSMMLLPLIRIMELYIPLIKIHELYWLLIIGLILLIAITTLAKSQGINRKKIGLVLGNIYVQILVALSGVILGIIEYYILKPEPLITSFNWESLIIASIIIIISTGLAEELFFRGILQSNAENILGNMFGLLYASILFTVLHIGWKSSLDIVFVFGVAVYYGYIFQKTKSIVGIALSHGLINIFLFLIMPFFAF